MAAAWRVRANEEGGVVGARRRGDPVRTREFGEQVRQQACVKWYRARVAPSREELSNRHRNGVIFCGGQPRGTSTREPCPGGVVPVGYTR
jgi:hypothetical protein